MCLHYFTVIGYFILYFIILLWFYFISKIVTVEATFP